MQDDYIPVVDPIVFGLFVIFKVGYLAITNPDTVLWVRILSGFLAVFAFYGISGATKIWEHQEQDRFCKEEESSPLALCAFGLCMVVVFLLSFT